MRLLAFLLFLCSLFVATVRPPNNTLRKPPKILSPFLLHSLTYFWRRSLPASGGTRDKFAGAAVTLPTAVALEVAWEASFTGSGS